MKISKASLKARITRLRRNLVECPIPGDIPEAAEKILRTAPLVLKDLEIALRQGPPGTKRKVHAVLPQIETDVDWAIGIVMGDQIAESIRQGKAPDSRMTAQRRLNQRLVAFMAGFTQADGFLALVREWAGDEVIRGDVVHLDPPEIDAMSQWMMHDKILPGQTRRLIDMFAEKQLSDIPGDEQDWLQRYVQDRPSIYRVSDIDNGEGYNVHDLLGGGTLKIRDRMSSLSLAEDAIVVGRAIPVAAKGGDIFCPLGNITELPVPLWSELSILLQQWLGEFNRQYPQGSSMEFFRQHRARMNRWMSDVRT
ncbi:MAG: hypothetical protein A2341_13645 [Deltaproteobacteria bacterium RIFOXYB12_FULL_58_9]|nr:MAG: hypothetical protein A2341_13645 [Deltaproteobacteria bacterium RIFOXYB12_FULL_58_9]